MASSVKWRPYYFCSLSYFHFFSTISTLTLTFDLTRICVAFDLSRMGVVMLRLPGVEIVVGKK